MDRLVELGARAVQVRPVARAGRARELAPSTFYDASDSARLYLVVLALQMELPDVRMHCDLAPAQGLWQQRDAYAGLLGDCEGIGFEDRPLADVVNPLVITDTGALKPIASTSTTASTWRRSTVSSCGTTSASAWAACRSSSAARSSGCKTARTSWTGSTTARA